MASFMHCNFAFDAPMMRRRLCGAALFPVHNHRRLTNVIVEKSCPILTTTLTQASRSTREHASGSSSQDRFSPVSQFAIPQGWLGFNKHRDHFGNDDDQMLVVQGASAVFNPTIDQRVIERARWSVSINKG